MQYTIGQAAEKMQLTPHTLRYYDREGLLPFVARTGSGIRLFTEKDFRWIRLIECLKASGMPIKKIKEYIDWYLEGDSSIPPRRAMFYAQKQAVEQQMQALQKTLDMLTYKCWFYDVAMQKGSTDAPRCMQPDALPEEIRMLKKKLGL